MWALLQVLCCPRSSSCQTTLACQVSLLHRQQCKLENVLPRTFRRRQLFAIALLAAGPISEVFVLWGMSLQGPCSSPKSPQTPRLTGFTLPRYAPSLSTPYLDGVNSVTVLAIAGALKPPSLALLSVNRSCLLQISARPKGSDSDKIPFLTNSWVADGFGGRIFFSGVPTLPDQTPNGLKELRQQELSNLRVGSPMPLTAYTSTLFYARNLYFGMDAGAYCPASIVQAQMGRRRGKCITATLKGSSQGCAVVKRQYWAQGGYLGPLLCRALPTTPASALVTSAFTPTTCMHPTPDALIGLCRCTSACLQPTALQYMMHYSACYAPLQWAVARLKHSAGYSTLSVVSGVACYQMNKCL